MEIFLGKIIERNTIKTPEEISGGVLEKKIQEIAKDSLKKLLGKSQNESQNFLKISAEIFDRMSLWRKAWRNQWINS